MRNHSEGLRRCGFALLTIALGAVVMSVPVVRDGAGTPVIIYFFVILLSAWYGGLGPGLLSTALIVALTLHTELTLWRAVRLGLGVAGGVSVCVLAETLHAARRRAVRSEERYRAFVANSSEGIWCFEGDEPVPVDLPEEEQLRRFYRQGRLTECNDAMARMFGHDRAERVVGRGLAEFLPPGDPKAEALLRDFIRSGHRLADAEVHGVDWEGRARVFQAGFAGVVEGGRLLRVWGTQRDVTEARRVEREARESRERLDLALKASGMGTWTLDAATGRVRWSEELEAIFGLAPGTFGGSLADFHAMVHPDDRPEMSRAIDRARRAGTEYEVEFRFLRPDGEVRWMAARGRSFRGPDGREERLAGVGMDVTARMRAEGAQRLLAEAGAVLSSTLDAGAALDALARLAVRLPADLCLIDMVEDDGTVRRVAAAHADPARQPLADLLRRYPPDPAGPHPAARALRGGRPEVADGVDDATLAATARDADHLDLIRRLGFGSYLCVPLAARGRPLGALTLVGARGRRAYDAADLALAEELARRAALAVDNARLYRATQRARLEAESADQAKDRFLAVLSHELRTPLTPVLAAVSALLDEPREPADVRPTLELVRRSVELEARLIDDLLDVTRIAWGKLHLNREVVDAHGLLHQTLGICRSDLNGKRTRLHLALHAARHHVEADPARLQQVFWNLLKNAVKFTDAGGSVSVRTRNEDGPGPHGRLVVEVADDGLGIAADALPRIFDAFEQGEDAVTRRFGGLGLGLAISRSVAEAHGGRLTAASPGPGRGATFTLELDAAEPPAAPSPADPTPARAEPGAGRAVRILLVEDDRPTLRVMTRLLARRGYEVTTAESVASALEAGANAAFDLVVSDIGLPDGSGCDLMRQLRDRRPIPGIALTGFGRDDDVSRTREAGFVAHLTKPIDFASLEAAIREATAGAL